MYLHPSMQLELTRQRRADLLTAAAHRPEAQPHASPPSSAICRRDAEPLWHDVWPLTPPQTRAEGTPAATGASRTMPRRRRDGRSGGRRRGRPGRCTRRLVRGAAARRPHPLSRTLVARRRLDGARDVDDRADVARRGRQRRGVDGAPLRGRDRRDHRLRPDAAEVPTRGVPLRKAITRRRSGGVTPSASYGPSSGGTELREELGHGKAVISLMRSPRRVIALSGPESLTASERRVAQMAPNRESRRHFLHHSEDGRGPPLSSVYRKLGISSRSQLPAALTQPARASSAGPSSSRDAPTKRTWCPTPNDVLSRRPPITGAGSVPPPERVFWIRMRLPVRR
jgi:hypothetical protein